MSALLFSVEAIGPRVASYSCPHGTTGRIHNLRLRRLFQPSGREGRSTSTARFDDQTWSPGYDEDNTESLPEIQRLSPLLRRSKSQLSDITDAAIERPSSLLHNRWVKKTGLSIESAGRVPKTHMGLRSRIRRLDASDAAIDIYDNDLTQAVHSGSPHAILNALMRLITIHRGKVRGNEHFCTMRPNTFSEILRCLNPDNFVGRYVDLNKNLIRPRMGRHSTYHFRMKNAVHEFRVKFMATVNLVIEARRTGGFDISLSDYKALLYHALAVDNPTASKSIWQMLLRAGFVLDTECYNYYLAGILRVSMSDGVQRSELRTKFIPQLGFEEGSEDSGLYYERLSVGFKNTTSQLFNEMLQQGIAGDEKTFCLLMISAARTGDLDGVKSLLDRVWGINVDKLMTMNENDLREPRPYPVDSPFRPTAKLLYALVHCFGINNMIPTALRVVDYISRKYSLVIPVEVWEDLLGLTFTLSSVPRNSKVKGEKFKPAWLSPEAVSVLWSAMTADPYNVRPTMAMYDRLIVNLLRRQRFGEAIMQIREAIKVQKKISSSYKEAFAIDKHLTPLMDRKLNHERLVQIQGATAYEHYLDLKREMTFQRHARNQSRHYLHRWCRLLLNFAPSSLPENLTFTVVDLPRFIHEHMQYMPKIIRYPIGTGDLSFNCDFENSNAVENSRRNPYNRIKSLSEKAELASWRRSTWGRHLSWDKGSRNRTKNEKEVE